MKQSYFLTLLATLLLATCLSAQTYRTSATEALQINGDTWISKTLPPSILTFSDYSGQVNIKVAMSSLFRQNDDSLVLVQSAEDTLADFTMRIDKEQFSQQQISSGKTFNTTGLLIINGISKKTPAQCQLIPRNNPSDGFVLSLSIRFNPGDFGRKINGDTTGESLIVRVTNGYLNMLKKN